MLYSPGPEWKKSCYRLADAGFVNLCNADTTRNTTRARDLLPSVFPRGLTVGSGMRATAHSMGVLTEGVRSTTVMTLEQGALYSIDTSFIHDDGILAMFQPSELMRLTAGLLAKLDSEIADEIARRRAQADPDRDIDSQFEEVSEFLDGIRYLVEADSVFENKFQYLTRALRQAKEEVEAAKSSEEEGSLFNSVPPPAQRERQAGRSVFSDVDE
jgi:hypothetical protein